MIVSQRDGRNLCVHVQQHVTIHVNQVISNTFGVVSKQLNRIGYLV